MEEKIKKLQKFIKSQNLDAIIVTNPVNIFYLTNINNFDSEKGFLLLVLQNKWRLISSLFYQNRIQAVTKNSNIIYVPRNESISEYALKEIGNTKIIGFEKNDLSYYRYEIFKKLLKGKKLIPISNAIEQLRQIKTNEELALIKIAASITDTTMAQIIKLIKPGVTEFFLKRKVLEIIQDLGGQSCSFDPIIASGKFSADPHYEGSNKKIKNGEMVVIDMGARYKNYDADLTRTVFVGKATPKFKQMYQAVFDIQQKALNDCKIGITGKEIYDNTVNRFKQINQDQYFTHGLGHGVGIDIHELPNLNAAGIEKLTNNMVFTVEPGLYYPNYGGVRIEDLCAMIDNKLLILSQASKNLIEI